MNQFFIKYNLKGIITMKTQTQTTPNINEAIEMLQSLHSWADSQWPMDDDGESPDEACIIHNYCISIAEALGINDITF